MATANLASRDPIGVADGAADEDPVSRHVLITHDFGVGGADESEDNTRDPFLVQLSFEVEPSSRPTPVTIRSAVTGVPLRPQHSPSYMAVLRRRGVASLIGLVDRLDDGGAAGGPDLVMAAYPIVRHLNALLDTLQDADLEGNTRETLRRVRNTLLNGEWDQYRRPEVRAVVTGVLRELVVADAVTSQMADDAFDRLFDVGLQLLPVNISDEADTLESPG